MMKVMRTIICHTGILLLLCLIGAGCMDFSYVGQEFAPTPESEPVTYYTGRSEVPAGQYGIIGRAEVIAPDGTDGFDIQALLLQRAREYGADAVCQVKAERIRVGAYFFSKDEYRGPTPMESPGGLNPDGSFDSQSSFGSVSDDDEEIRYRYKVEVKALFLKNKKQLTALLEERRRELDHLLTEGESADAAEAVSEPAGAAAKEEDSALPAASGDIEDAGEAADAENADDADDADDAANGEDAATAAEAMVSPAPAGV